ncbi:hypothetical protein QBC35DRAFT_424186 [Podospora australis]|uniref:Uncharacterized protein n=1 Tax=Podospora australis TaxID=1536484 RepID=A0AAN7AMU8_9PEZI|nr:hypothetical protein QBC35DRAFT_424186 [Podospora australis]
MAPPIPSGIDTAYTATIPPVPTPTYGPGGTFTIACSSRINASPETCLGVVLDASNCTSFFPFHPAWNKFCRKCTIDAQPHPPSSSPSSSPSKDTTHLRFGTQFTFDVHLNPDAPQDGRSGRPTALEVSLLGPVPPYEGEEAPRKGVRVAWKPRSSFLMPEWMLRSERVQDFLEMDGGKATEYFCFETFYGVLAPVVKLAVGSGVEKGFRAWMEGLEGRAEEIAPSSS